jgi:hypothetical protein
MVPAWHNAMKTVSLEAAQDECLDRPAATLEAIWEAIEMTSIDIQAVLAIAWFTAARIGDVLKLERMDILYYRMDLHLPEVPMSVVYRKGKGARFTQPYTVPTLVPGPIAGILDRFLAPCPRQAMLFPVTSPAAYRWFSMRVTAALRAADATLCQRSVRRGALQTMAKKGVPWENLMIFSGHKRLDTLKRYLSFGRHDGAAVVMAQTAARHLGGSL